MRDLRELGQFRRSDMELRAHGVLGDQWGGCFAVMVGAQELTVIASSGGGWDHLSISTPFRCPTWDEMEFVRKLFSKATEVWIQFGVPMRVHINEHPYCLHWWRHQTRELRLPPGWMVA